MKLKTALLGALASCAAVFAQSTQATTFLLRFSGIHSSTGGPITLVATPDGGGIYTVISATGFIDSNAVTLEVPFTYQGNDNLIFYPPSVNEIDVNGISFSEGGNNFNVFFLAGYQEQCSCDISASDLDTFSLTEVPEPGAWALMLCGFAGLGATLRSRRSKRSLSALA